MIKNVKFVNKFVTENLTLNKIYKVYKVKINKSNVITIFIDNDNGYRISYILTKSWFVDVTSELREEKINLILSK